MDGWFKGCVYGPYREGWVGLGSELWPVEVMVRTEYYRVMMQKYDVVWLATAILLKRPGELAACGLLRGKTQSNFDDRALHLLKELTPHMQAAIRAYNRTGELQQNLDSLELALDQFAIGVLVLDNTSAVIFANSIAQRQLSLKDGLVLEGGKIKTTGPRDSALLEATIQEAIQASESTGAHKSSERNVGVAPIRRKHGPALHAFVAPWLSDRQLALVKPAAVVLIAQPERKIPREAWLETLYGLTVAESKLALLIAGGMDGPEAASQLGLSPETVRTRLKTVFSKTNTRRQSDLARVLASLPQG
jgi:DNA-binding CsgD family transcriptional regulator